MYVVRYGTDRCMAGLQIRYYKVEGSRYRSKYSPTAKVSFPLMPRKRKSEHEEEEEEAQTQASNAGASQAPSQAPPISEEEAEKFANDICRFGARLAYKSSSAANSARHSAPLWQFCYASTQRGLSVKRSSSSKFFQIGRTGQGKS